MEGELMGDDFKFEPFDFNGDGKVDAGEELLGYMIMSGEFDAEDQNEDALDKNFPDDDEYPR
ncbi:MAG: hypothetical protein IIZ35_03195 [Clostridia bacterium]|nr:hypothetical protein [Clostridia bacterium]MBQ2468171.1 hypothetical protein [Clostridia bacterium]MBQ6677115.1 hypothetical protein [Clostridia bacterium]